MVKKSLWIFHLSWMHVILVLTVALAFVVRAYPLNFPRYHWDEGINFDSVFYASFNHLQVPSYVHGSFFQYLILFGWDAFLVLHGNGPTPQNLLTTWVVDPTSLLIVARGLMALAGTATVAATFLLGRRLYDARVGLLSAFFVALTFLHVSESHYARGHILAAWLATLAVYFCARILAEGRARDYACAGAAIGLATAAQYSAILAMLPLLAVHFARAWGQWRKADWRALVIGLDCAGLAFFIVTPYALLDFSVFFGEMKGFVTQVVAHTWVDPEGRPVWLFYLTEHLQNGTGLTLEIVALAGIAYALYRHRAQEWVLLAFPIPLFITLGKGENFARYALPLLPFLAISAARLLSDSAAGLQARFRVTWVSTVLAIVSIALMIPSTLNLARFDYWLTQPDTRALAAQWIEANVPPDSSIVIEGAGVLGPPVSPSLAQIDAQIAAAPPDSVTVVYLQALRANVRAGSGYRVESVFRLDQQHINGVQIGTVKNASEYAKRGVDYLVAVNWMQRDVADRYAPEFAESLESAYQRVAEFHPTIEFRFDPYAWRMDYDALAQVVPGQPGTGGPRLDIYRRRAEGK